jgi:hypothetical protein
MTQSVGKRAKNDLEISRLRKLSAEYDAEIKGVDPWKEGHVGFSSRCLTIASLPHSKPIDPLDPSGKRELTAFERCSGRFRLSISSPPSIGLPYGRTPRLLLYWITAEVLRTKDRRLLLGDSLSDFMRELEIIPKDGRPGGRQIKRLHDQTLRLFASTIDLVERVPGREGAGLDGMKVIDKGEIWWKTKLPQQSTLWNSWVELSPAFFAELLEHPVPVNMLCIKKLKGSAMALDIYTWLTWRFSYLTEVQAPISWEQLEAQFGANYQSGLKGFKQNFRKELAKVLMVYKDARIGETPKGLQLFPSRTSVPKMPEILPAETAKSLREKAEYWKKKYPNWYRKFTREMDNILEATVGSSRDIDAAEIAEVVSRRTGIPLDICCGLMDVAYHR